MVWCFGYLFEMIFFSLVIWDWFNLLVEFNLWFVFTLWILVLLF